MSLKTILATSAIIGTMAIAGAASALELRLATIAPDKSVWVTQINRYVDRVKELSGGDIIIEVFPGAQLGNMGDTIKMTLSGRLDMWVGVMPVMAAVTPELSLLTFPYMFEDPEEIKCVVPKLEGKIRETIGGKYEFIAPMNIGGQSLGLKGEARVPGDLAGRKIRTAPLKSSMEFFSSMGATPLPLPAAETTAALNTGLVEGVDLAVVYYVTTGSNKVATTLIPTKHVNNLGSVIVSARTWAKLSDDQKAIMHQAADALDFSQLVDEIVAFEEIMVGLHLKSGGTVLDLTDAELAEWRAVGRASWDTVMPDIRGDVTGFMAAIQEAQAACSG